MNFIKTYDNALPTTTCMDIINRFDEDVENHKTGVFSEGTIDESIKQSTDLFINTNENWNDIKDILLNSLMKYFPEYMGYFIEQNNRLTPFYDNNIIDSGYQIQRTEPGQFYDWHHDTNIIEYFLNGGRIHRHLAYIWYLNDVPVEDDGYTEFIDGTRIQPEAGKLLFFPATWTYLHRGVAPKKTKYIITGWMCSLK
jgi:hypothetical protein